jgi:hypothetical protein
VAQSTISADLDQDRSGDREQSDQNGSLTRGERIRAENSALAAKALSSAPFESPLKKFPHNKICRSLGRDPI